MIPVPADMTPGYRRKRISEVIRSINVRTQMERDGHERFCKAPTLERLYDELIELLRAK